MGLALDLWDEVSVHATTGATSLVVEGEGAGNVEQGEDNLVVRALRLALDRVGAPQVGVRMHCTNRIPHSRGLGSSASAIVAVSNGMRDDILRCYPAVDPKRVHVIHNGIDLNKWHAPEGEAGEELRARVLAEHGIDPSRRTVVFVGRITRQKGLPYFLRAAQLLPDDVQLVLCAGAPDTPEIAAEVEGLVAELRARRSGVVLISEMLPQPEVAAILSSAQVFITPSVYEPLGIVNLEAMALGLPVVGTATGGIPDVIVDGETGYLVPIEQKQDGTGTPLDPRAFEEAMADRLVRILDDPELGRRMGEAGLVRARDHFSWEAIGVKTAELYRSLV